MCRTPTSLRTSSRPPSPPSPRPSATPPAATSTCSSGPAPTGATAAEVAEGFALHPNVARHHLEKLAGGGYLDVELARHESAGRPSKRYRASADDSHLAFPPRRDDLLATLLARALERLPVEEAREIAEEVGLEYGRAMAARMEPTEGHRSVKAAVASVADALTAHGFAAHAETRGNALTLVAEHCPFGEAARQYPHVLCAVDTGMVKGMLEGLYGETAADHRAESPARRRQLRHPRLRRRPWRARTSITHRRRRCDPAALDAMLPYLREHHADPGPAARRRARRRASRSKTRASRWPRSSAPGRARSCSRRREPSR